MRPVIGPGTTLDGIEWGSMGLRVGLEIHRQICDTKLFCPCPTGLQDASIMTVSRKLHLSRSEMGSYDEAAFTESQKGLRALYEVTSNTCLVELDEEPPHAPSEGSIDTSLTIALMLGCDAMDEVRFMRKIVIDGSNPSGFQRTAVVGLGGSIEVEGRLIPIQQVCLEEDAGRRIGEMDGNPIYRLDRAGTAEVEISTAPEIGSPHQAMEVARRIGDIVKATGRARRGIGTVRQDVNVSIEEGTRVEIKLVQDLATVQKAVLNESVRQMLLIEVREILARRCGGEIPTPQRTEDLTDAFAGTACKVLNRGMAEGGSVIGMALRHFARLMGSRYDQMKKEGTPVPDPVPGYDDLRRLGPEFAGRVKAATGLKGLFHSDELPGYGITNEEVRKVREMLELGPDDGFVMVCAPRTVALRAIGEVTKRALEAFTGVVPEVRRALPDGRSEYMRPMPGPARMYPETDVPPIPIDRERLERIASSLPQDPVVRIGLLGSRTGIPKESLVQLIRFEGVEELEWLIAEGAEPRTASFLLLKAFQNLGTGNVQELPRPFLLKICNSLRDGALPKEAVDEILRKVIAKDGRTVTDISALDEILSGMTGDTIEDERLLDSIDALITERWDYVSSRGLDSAGALMGILMKGYRGKVSGAKLGELLRRRIGSRLEGGR